MSSSSQPVLAAGDSIPATGSRGDRRLKANRDQVEPPNCVKMLVKKELQSRDRTNANNFGDFQAAISNSLFYNCEKFHKLNVAYILYIYNNF